jgi:hypothetical protein
MTKLMNCSHIINWKDVVNNLAGPGTPAYINPEGWVAKANYNEIARLWVDANMNFPGVGVYNYEPGEDFPNTVTEAMENLMGLTHIESWITRIPPGMMAPYHWDFDHPIIETLTTTPRRVSVHICDFEFGHVFILEDECIYNYTIGDVHEFPNIRSWHAGGNLGIVPKYMYHFVGY